MVDFIKIGKAVKEEWSGWPGIYLLMKDEEVIYVGQTTNIYSRMRRHHVKDFDSILFLPFNKELMNKCELFYIQRFQPKMNSTGTRKKYKKMTQIEAG